MTNDKAIEERGSWVEPRSVAGWLRFWYGVKGDRNRSVCTTFLDPGDVEALRQWFAEEKDYLPPIESPKRAKAKKQRRNTT